MGERTLFGALTLLVLAGFAIFIATRGPGQMQPGDELAFIHGMEPILQQAREAGDLQALQARRAAMICRTVRNLQVQNWLGTVDQTGTAPNGGGILSISVMPEVDFGTAPSAQAPEAGKTLLAVGSQVFQSAQALHPGQQVRFSGALVASPKDCVQDAANTLSGSMRDPWFLIKFSSVAPPG